MRKVKKWLAGLLCATMVLTGSVPVMAAEQATQEQASVQLPTYVAPKIDVVTLINYYIVNLDVEGYKKKNPDLLAVFGDNTPMYILHYVLCGIPEGRRTATWDPVAFVVNNGDAIGQSILEGKTDFFNIAKYRAAYPDLEALYGNDGSMYLAHYLTAGILAGEVSGGTFDPVTYAKSNPNSDLRTNLKPTDFAKAVKAEQSRPASVIAVSSSSASDSNSSSSSGSGGSSGGTSTTSEAITKIAFRMQQNGDDQVYEVEIPVDGLAFQNEDDLYFKDLWQSLYSDYQVSLVTYVSGTVKGIYPLTYTDFDIDNLDYTATLTLDKYFFKESLKFASGVPTKLIITYEPDALPVEDGVIDNYAICMVMEGEKDNPTVKITNHPFAVIDESLTTFQAIWDDMAKMGSMYIVAFTGDKEVKRVAVNISDFAVDDEQGAASLDLLKLFGSDVKVNEKAPTSLDFKYNFKYVKLDEFRLYYELDKESGKVYDYAIDDIFDLSENGYTSFEELYNNVLKDSLFVKCYSDGILQDTKSIALSDFKVNDSTHIATFEIDSNYLGSKYVIADNINTTIAIRYASELLQPPEDEELNEYGDYKDSTYSNKFVYPTIEFTDLGLSYTLPVKLTDLLADGWCMGTVPMQDIRTSAGDEKEYSLYHPDLQYSGGKEKPAWRILSTKNTTLSDAYVTGITLYPGYDKFSINGYTFEEDDTAYTISEKLKANSAKPGKYYYSVSDLNSDSQNRDSSSMEFTYFDGLSSIQIIGHYNKAVSVDEESIAVEASQKSLYENMKATYDDYELQLGMTFGQAVKVFGTTITNDENIKAGKTLNEKVPIADGVDIYLEFKNFSDYEVPVSECRLVYMEGILTGGLAAVPYENSLFFKDFKAGKTSYTDTSKVLGKIENLEFWKSDSQWSASWTDTDGYKICIEYADAENKIHSWHLRYTADTADSRWPITVDEKLITDIQAYKEIDGVKENISLDESYSNTGDITVSDAWSKFLDGKTAGITFNYSDGTTKDIVLDIAKMIVDESVHTATLNFDESLLGEDCKLSEGLDTKFVFTININKPEITSITAKTSDGVDISLTPTFTTSEHKDSVEDYWNAYLDGKTVSIEATLSDDSTKQYPISFEKLTVDESSNTATLKLNSDFFGEDYELLDTLPTEFVFTVVYSQQEIDSLAITGNGLSGTKQTGTAGANFEVTTNNGENYSTKSDIQEVASRGYTLIGYIGDETVKHVLTVDDFTKYQAANDDRTFKITADIFGENYKFADGLSFTIHIAHKIDMDS